MRLEIRRYELPLRSTFTISRGSISVQETVVVELHDQGEFGLGEAPRSTYYGQTADSIVASLRQLEPELRSYEFSTPEQLWEFARPRLSGNSFALSALDQAAHDLHGKLHGVSVYQRQGLSWNAIPRSSVTISIADISRMLEEMSRYAGWPIFKVKLGTAHDLEIMRALREQSDATFRIDANCAWTVEETLRNSQVLSELGVEFIEQPLPADASDADKRKVFQESALPVLADESCVSEEDVRRCSGRFHGINVKLCKCGGLTPAFRMLNEARRLGMKTMVGCMIESEVAISAAAQLLPLLDYADLDGAFLLASQPAKGMKLYHGTFSRPRGHGCGVGLSTPLV